MKIESILCPVDFSDHSREAVEYAVEFARVSKSTLYLVHVVPAFEYAGYLDEYLPLPTDEFYEELVKQSEEELRKLSENAAGVEVRTMVRRGTPYAEIVAFAREAKADLIVLSSHGRSGIREFFFGSTAEKVLRKAHCPVLIIPPGWIQAPRGGSSCGRASTPG